MSDINSQLDALKNAFGDFGNNNSNNSQGNFWSKFYSFWKMEIGEMATVRFVPDANTENPLGFVLENLTHNLTINGKRKKVPCLSMYGESCPCCNLARKFYAEEGENSENGRKYWKKKEYLSPIMVKQSPFEYENPEDILKVVSYGPKVFKVIQAAFARGDLTGPPQFFKGGHDFRFIKTQNGQYADYSTSAFAPMPSDLDDDTIAQIEENQINLEDFRTKYMEPSEMEALIQADLTGAAYTPAGQSNGGTEGFANAMQNLQSQTPQATPQVTPQAPATPQAQPTPVAPAPAATPAAAPSGGDATARANDILAKIRQGQ